MSVPKKGVEIAKRFQMPLIMGIVNCTPDSFHEKSRASTYEAAVERAARLVEEGADILDFGGQSTRPGSDAVSESVEIERVIPVIKEAAKRLKIRISIDTDKAAVAEQALDAGAVILNDITALRGDKAMVKAALKADRVILMHMQGSSPKTMQANPSYVDCFAEVSRFLEDHLHSFLAAGGRREQVVVDPGIGFGKTVDHNLTLIRRAGELASLAPVLLGVSRKSFLGKIINDTDVENRLDGSLAIAAYAAMNGISYLRVHDVLATRRLLDTLRAVSESA